MKKAFLFLACLPIFFATTFAQNSPQKNAQDSTKKESAIDSNQVRNLRLGARFLDAKKPDSARTYLKKAVIDMPKNAYIWYLLGISDELLNDPQEALINFGIALELSENADYILIRRGLFYLNNLNYTPAIDDFSRICSAKLPKINGKETLEEQKEFEETKLNKGKAHYYRALAYDYLKEYKKCQNDILEAEKLGAIKSEKQKQRLDILRTTKRAANYNNIGIVSKRSTDPDYGFTPAKPVKVGIGIDGMAANEYIYLRRLLDTKGNQIGYTRKGSCCPYPSKFAFIGKTALVDHFEIEYQDATGKTVKRDFYISMYDYEELLIPIGLDAEKPYK